MNARLDIQEIPEADEIIMITGWRQWADAGSISSGLPDYLIRQMDARKIGEIKPDGFYLFQLPGAHHLLRPQIRLEDGFRRSLEIKRNEFYFAEIGSKGLIIFLGDEPHLDVDAYAEAYFEAAKTFNVSEIAGVAGVYASVPYDQERQMSCIYSLQEMKNDLESYAVTFSNYEGGSSIGSYLVSKAETWQIPFFILYAFVPAYNFGQNELGANGVSVENDYKAWHDAVRRFNHRFELGIDGADLQRRSDKLVDALDEKMTELEDNFPQLNVREYLATLNAEFNERPFMPLDDVWEQEFRNLFDDVEDSANQDF